VYSEQGLPLYVVDVGLPGGTIERTEPLGTWYAAHLIPPVNEAQWTLLQLLEAEGWRLAPRLTERGHKRLHENPTSPRSVSRGDQDNPGNSPNLVPVSGVVAPMPRRGSLPEQVIEALLAPWRRING